MSDFNQEQNDNNCPNSNVDGSEKDVSMVNTKETSKDSDKKKRPLDKTSDARCKCFEIFGFILILLEIIPFCWLRFVMLNFW